jgi:uncharacterized cupredoxin-like copper-binding protein
LIMTVVMGAAAVLAVAGCSTTDVYPSSGAMMAGGAAGGMIGSTRPESSFSTPTCVAPASLPGPTVRVMLGDMGMTRMMGGTALGSRMMLRAIPETVPAGQVSLVVDNKGWRTHEVVVLPLPTGAVAGQRRSGTDGKVDESGRVGEVSGSCTAGSGEGITAGAIGWTTLRLARGRYELICNEPNHYSDGMHEELIVI